MIKNTIRIVKAIIYCAIIMTSPYACAVVVHVPVEIKCSRNPMVAPWVIFGGAPETQYTLITKGLRETGKEVLEVVEVDGVGRTHDGLYVYAEARCIPSNKETRISLTGNFLACKPGEGIKIAMLEPNSGDPEQYSYIGTLHIARNEKKVQKAIVSDIITVRDVVDEQLQSNMKFLFQE